MQRFRTPRFLAIAGLLVLAGGCDTVEDRIAELAGDWEGYCFYDKAGTAVLSVSIEENGDVTGYESGYGTPLVGVASYYGRFLLSAGPLFLDGYRDRDELRGDLEFDDGGNTDSGSFLLIRLGAD